MKTDLQSKINIYGKEFTLYKDEKITAYYSVYFYKYSEKLKKKQYFFHFILLTKFKLSNYTRIYNLEEKAIKEMLSREKVDQENSVFYMIMELSAGAMFVPDLKMVRTTSGLKEEIEKKTHITLSHAAVIIPSKYKRAFRIFKFASTFFGRGKKLSIITNNYEDAINEIDELDFILDNNSIRYYWD